MRSLTQLGSYKGKVVLSQTLHSPAVRKKQTLDCGYMLETPSTRWNSTLIMISRLLEVRTELSNVLQELSWNNLQNSEWKQLENLHSLLKPFAKYTALTSGEDYTTISTVIPVLMELSCHLDAVNFRNV